MNKRTSPVRSDDHGLFIITNGSRYRPGAVAGYDHAYRMDDGGLKVGDRVLVRNVPQTPLCKIVHGETTLHWYSEDA